MPSPDDLIEYPAQPGEFARRALVEALQRAGSPRTNSLTRLYAEQKRAWDAYQNGTGAGADNPDDESQALAHVRGVAADVDATAANIAALSNAGLIRPYSWEPWHWTLPGDPRRFPIIRNRPNLEEDDMFTDQDRATLEQINRRLVTNIEETRKVKTLSAMARDLLAAIWSKLTGGTGK